MVSIKDEEIYKKSHGSYNPGEQKKRDYNWPINPTSTVFGMKGQSNAFNGVSKNIEIVLKGDTTQSTLVNSKRVSCFELNFDLDNSMMFAILHFRWKSSVIQQMFWDKVAT